MVSSVSNYSSIQNINTMSKSPQERSLPSFSSNQASPASHSMSQLKKILKVIAKITVATIAIGGTAVLLRKKTSLKDFKVDVKPEKILEKAKYYAAKFGDFIINLTKKIPPKTKDSIGEFIDTITFWV